MQPTKFVLVSVLCALAFGQSGARIMSGSATTGKVGFYFETRLEPPSPPLAESFSGGVETGAASTRRVMIDRVRRRYFGYDIQIDPLPQANTYQVTFRPLSMPPREIASDHAGGWALVPLSVYPTPQTVHGGETIALELFTNAATGQKIVDYIRIHDQGREVVYANDGPARDFTATDAEIRLLEPHVSVNGELVPATANFTGGIAGSAVWFYLPGHGRYFLSLVPHPEFGFQRAGEIRGNALTIRAGADIIGVDCNGSIAPGNAPYNLYVLYDGGWRPNNAAAIQTFRMAAGDHLEKLLHR